MCKTPIWSWSARPCPPNGIGRWRHPCGWRGLIADALAKKWDEAAAQAWIAVGRELNHLNRQEASLAIRVLSKERRLQRQRAAALAAEPVPF